MELSTRERLIVALDVPDAGAARALVTRLGDAVTFYKMGLELFTALQMQKVPSKLLIFADEGHWVTKPQNSILWYKTFIEWMDSWVKK